ncbi:MAG: acyltransferase family protein, partial [Neobacillus sp.]|nr:acyltransferase family protein [Neobacillus sp.]
LASHFISIFLSVEREIISNYSYISFLYNGHSAVIIFFVLSGFVLSIPFHSNMRFIYWKYLIKRICRIYIPYIVIIIIVIVLKIVLNSKVGTIPGLTPWGLWDTKVSFNIIMKHILFLVEYNSDAFLMVIWSLVHEMRISIIFPFVMFFLIRIDWKVSIGLAMILSFVSSFFMGKFPSEFDTTISTNYFITLHYLSFFIIGA